MITVKESPSLAYLSHAKPKWKCRDLDLAACLYCNKEILPEPMASLELQRGWLRLRLRPRLMRSPGWVVTYQTTMVSAFSQLLSRPPTGRGRGVFHHLTADHIYIYMLMHKCRWHRNLSYVAEWSEAAHIAPSADTAAPDAPDGDQSDHSITRKTRHHHRSQLLVICAGNFGWIFQQWNYMLPISRQAVWTAPIQWQSNENAKFRILLSSFSQGPKLSHVVSSCDHHVIILFCMKLCAAPPVVLLALS